MGEALWERFDARSAAVLASTSGAFFLPIFAFASPELVRPGAMPALVVVWLYTLASFAFTLRAGRLNDSQFAVIGFCGMVGVAVSAFVVTDPAAARAIVALLSAIPAIAAMASTKRVTLLFTIVAIVFAVVLSVYWSASNAAQLVAAGAAILTVCVPIFMVAVLRSSLEFAMEKVSRLGEVDPLTGALNRRGLVRRHARVFDRCSRSGEAVGFLLIDIDHFKEVNDSLGHAAGDKVLVDSVRTITNAAPAHSLVSRIGGEEFVVMCGVDSVADMSAEASRIRAAVAEEGQVTVSVGAVFAPVERAYDGLPNISEIIDALTRQADRSVYRAKGHGRDRVIMQTAPTIHWHPGVPAESPGHQVDLSDNTGLRSLVNRARDRQLQAPEPGEARGA
ncbi:MAG: diguanylate cyclase [Dietzia sp.]